MPRSDISGPFREAMYAEETDKVFILLLTVEEASLTDPIRVALNNESVDSRGETFAAFYFEFEGPEEKRDSISPVRIRLDNVDRRIVLAIENAVGRPKVTVELVLADNPDQVEVGPTVFELDNAKYDLWFVEGELIFEEVVNRSVSAHSVTPGNFPDLYVAEAA